MVARSLNALEGWILRNIVDELLSFWVNCYFAFCFGICISVRLGVFWLEGIDVFGNLLKFC